VAINDSNKENFYYETAPKLFAEHLGPELSVKIVWVKWDQLFHNEQGKTDREGTYTPYLLASEQCDLYATHVTKNDWRLKKLDFITLYPSRMMIIGPKSKQSLYKKASDLGGKRASVLKNTSFHTWLNEQNNTLFKDNPIVVIPMDSTMDSLRAPEEGKADFSMDDADYAVWATKAKLKNSVAYFPVGPIDDIGWAFQKKDKDLQAACKKFFKQQRASKGSPLNLLWKKRFGMTLTKFTLVITSIK